MRRELKSWEPAVCMVIGGLLISLQPRLVRAQAAARVPWQSEPEWQQAYEKARLADPAGFRVESLEEFKRITVYFQQLESEGTTRHSFHTAAGDSISCIDIASQRSFLQSAAPGSQPLTSPIQPPSESDRTTRSEADASGTLRNLFGLDGSADEDGHVRACQAGTFPRLMPKLSNFYHARNLEEIFQKYPDGYRGLPPHGATNSTPADSRDPGWRPADSTTGAAIRDSSVSSPASPPTNHEYAHAAETAYNIGSQALFNLWSPFVQQNDEFSLSQLWEIQGRYSDNTLQSVEFGWQVFPNKYGDSKAHLFIYSTSAAYTAGSGCYNLDCSRFVQTSSSVVVGGSFSTYSANGGTQYEVPLVVYRDPASQNWWLKFNGTWVGYYPNSLFNASGISNFASSIDFGGEIINDAVGGVHTATQMGSGHFASGGYGTAAYIKTIQYWDTNGNLYNAGGLSPNATNPTDYNLALFSSSDPNWLTYFFFGGPGNPSANNSLPNL
ncbi:MAG: neprosin family prolyl endopeptidase, partial [Thermoanaerobaculia bacterium]